MIWANTMASIEEYTFTSDQRAFLKQAMELVWEREREPVYIEYGMSGRFEASRIGIEGNEDSPLFSLLSIPTEGGPAFAVVKLGPPPELNAEEITRHSSFAEAIQELSTGIEAFIQHAKAPFRNLRMPAFSDEDRQWFERLANVLGKQANHQGFADIQNLSEGAQVCGVGIVVNGQRIVIASIVGTYGPDGFECSVRNFQNEQVPGTQNYFSSVTQAIGAHQGYFTAITNSLSERSKPWWKKIF